MHSCTDDGYTYYDFNELTVESGLGHSELVVHSHYPVQLQHVSLVVHPAAAPSVTLLGFDYSQSVEYL